ncbi:MAG: hypothetical protein JWN76_3803 [Chitinophagaceae bacterium]|nr:hypothetical protein [Chitinophagaceae bacterium]
MAGGKYLIQHFQNILMQLIKQYSYFFVVVVLLWSCANYDKKKMSTSDSTRSTTDVVTTVDSTISFVDSTRPSGYSTDTLSAGGHHSRRMFPHSGREPASVDSARAATADDPVPESEKKSAVLGYSFFKRMRQHETRNVFVYIKINHSSSEIKSQLQELNTDTPPERKDDTATILTKNMLLYNNVTAELIQGEDDDFVIKPLHNKAQQELDSVNGNKWQWAVTPKTNKRHARLIIKIDAQRSSGSNEPIVTQTVAVDITLDNIFDITWRWLHDNPEKTLVLILIPVAAYFGKKIFDKRKATQPEKT